MECPECNEKMKKEKEAMALETNPNVIVKEVNTSVCKGCGFSSISENEYERVRKEIDKIKAPKEATIIL